MKMFLVKGRVQITKYMGDARSFDDVRLVLASTAQEAEQKYASWWEMKTEEYSHYYSAVGEAMETIE